MTGSASQADRWLPLLDDIADQADAIALRLFRSRDLKVDEKADHSPVSEADRAIEAAAREEMRSRHPEVGVFGEEEGEEEGEAKGESADRGSTRLIIDPIDGTRNFVRGVPFFATLLALEEDGEVVAGVISAPAIGHRWRAARGAGAFADTRRLRVSAVSDLAEAEIFHGDLSGRAEIAPPPGFAALVADVRRTRGYGDFLQHVLVAEGTGEMAVDPVVAPWDIAAVQIIVEEAGGRATTLDGRRDIHGGSLVTSNGVLHDTFLERLRGAKDEGTKA